jgi:DNA helicase HerA-like ATPase
MLCDNKILIAKGNTPVYLLPEMANRHGLIAGATGTGKTVTLKVLAESFSDRGVPVFLADIKGDLAGLAVEGADNPKIRERVDMLGIEGFEYKSYPVRFWDIFGEGGHLVRTTISEMGAILLSRLLELNETQSGIMNIVFRIADDKGLLLIDLKDLRAMLQYVGENAKDFTIEYGSISTQSVGAILRKLIAIEDQGGNYFFGEPDLNIFDFINVTPEGCGYINILHSVKLFQNPILYTTFLLWMLSELFESLPEVDDVKLPKIVFFFDEAHLLFKDAPKVLIQKIEQVVRLIRSKGVGVYFVTQDPCDLPDEVLGQLGNRIQHALRAFTPKHQKMVKAAAQTFRTNPDFDIETAITELATGEALVSCLDEHGSPGIVERAFILPPQSQMGTIDDETRKDIISSSLIYGKYDKTVDSESAYELLQAKARQAAKEEEEETAKQQSSTKTSQKRTSNKKSLFEKAFSSAATSIGRELGRSLVRGILGSLKK